MLRDTVSINDLTKRIKGRVLTVSEVGHAFELSLAKNFLDFPHKYMLKSVRFSILIASKNVDEKFLQHGNTKHQTKKGVQDYINILIFVRTLYSTG